MALSAVLVNELAILGSDFNKHLLYFYFRGTLVNSTVCSLSF